MTRRARRPHFSPTDKPKLLEVLGGFAGIRQSDPQVIGLVDGGFYVT